MRRVYLAGDIVFRRDGETIYAGLRDICRELGLQGVAPIDGQVALAGLPPGEATVMAIVAADRKLMDECDCGLFCLDGFRRAADMDPGTAVELGYMFAQGKKLCGYTADPRLYREKLSAYFAAAWQGTLRRRPSVPGTVASGTLEDPDGMLVHSEGMLQNGMAEGFIRLSGGRVFGHPQLQAAFRLAAAHLADAA
jgi:nucleoside 2-deoxyribosyltransferase